MENMHRSAVFTWVRGQDSAATRLKAGLQRGWCHCRRLWGPKVGTSGPFSCGCQPPATKMAALTRLASPQHQCQAPLFPLDEGTNASGDGLRGAAAVAWHGNHSVPSSCGCEAGLPQRPDSKRVNGGDGSNSASGDGLRGAAAAVSSSAKHAWKCLLHVGARQATATAQVQARLRREWLSVALG
ncbi:uncharacterized protein LOC144100459 [Amblyomma americanum]